ncbi:MAG TPA: hypothetical protein VNO86_06585 [Candidatus Binatia bacterium]|nr:hypothetical protein [Candidatus Binatia bacterium]
MVESTSEHPLVSAPTAGRRQLALALVVVGGLSVLVDPPVLWLVGALLAVAMGLGTLQILGERQARGVAVEALILPAVLAVATVGVVRLVPLGLALVPVLAVAAFGLDRLVVLEARIDASERGPSRDDRAAVLTLGLGLAFAAFVGVAGTVPGGLVSGPGEVPPIAGGDLVALVGLDALVGAALGYRFAALREPSIRGALLAAATYAGVVAIAAGVLRLLALPRLVGPAVLTLVVFLWDAVHGDTLHARRPWRFWDVRRLVELLVLVVLGVLVVVLNSRLVG